MPHCHTFNTIGSHSPNAKNKSDSINHCFTNYFKTGHIEAKFKQLNISMQDHDN